MPCDALKALHTILTVSRSFSTSPYTPTRQFVGDYIILSAVEQESKSDSWQANLIASKGINLWNGVVNLRALYLNSDASMLQNGIMTDYNSQMLNVRTGLDQQSDAQRPHRSRLLFLEGYAPALWSHVQSEPYENPVDGLFAED